VYVANFHGEASELWEAARAGKLHELCDKAEKMREHGIKPMTCLEEEVADMLIRVLDIGNVFGLDIDDIVARKHMFNKTRPYRHGGKLV
jgi:NTP pyrophosphatase (non-canonical NTP hydrolase)